MASKNTRGGNTKKAAAKSLKEKRLAKKSKRTADETAANQSVDRTFGR